MKMVSTRAAAIRMAALLCCVGAMDGVVAWFAPHPAVWCAVIPAILPLMLPAVLFNPSALQRR